MDAEEPRFTGTMLAAVAVAGFAAGFVFGPLLFLLLVAT